MNQLTVRGFDSELESRIRELAQRRGISLNKAALLLLRRGGGLEPAEGQTNVVGDSLDEFIGVWSREEEQEFLDAIEVFERVDESLWSWEGLFSSKSVFRSPDPT